MLAPLPPCLLLSPKTVAVFRAHLKLEVVAGGWGGKEEGRVALPIPCRDCASRKLLLSGERNIAGVQCCPSPNQPETDAQVEAEGRGDQGSTDKENHKKMKGLGAKDGLQK